MIVSNQTRRVQHYTDLKQIYGSSEVDSVVPQRLLHGLPNRLQASKVHHRTEGMLRRRFTR